MRRTNKIFLCVIAVLIVLVFTFAGCQSAKMGADQGPAETPNGGASEASTSYDIGGAISGRKVIYSAYATIHADDPKAAMNSIKGKLNDDEWVDMEDTSESYGTIVVRIKSTRLTGFLESLSSLGKVGDYTIKSQDVTSSYSDIEQEIAKNEQIKARLEDLIPSASSLEDIIKLEQALAEVESQLTSLNNRKNSYDSLIDYSTVTIYVNQNYYEVDPSFKDTTKTAIKDSWVAFGTFFIYLFWGIIYAFPFLLAGGIIAFVVIICIRKKKGLPLFKKAQKKEEIKENK